MGFLLDSRLQQEEEEGNLSPATSFVAIADYLEASISLIMSTGSNWFSNAISNAAFDL